MSQNPHAPDPFDGVTKAIAYSAGAFLTFFGWPPIFYGSIEAVQAHAFENYSALPSGLVSVFWGLVVVAALFGLTGLAVILLIKLVLKALGRL